jgi:multidrug resistance efflux pump
VRKLVILLLALASVAGLGMRFAPWNGRDDKAAKKSGFYLPDQVAANGIVEGVTPAIEIRSEHVGTIAAIHFREGQTVTRGTVLIELSNDTQKEQVKVAEAEVAVAEAQLAWLENGERPEKRKVMADAEAVAKAALDHAELQWKQAKTERDRGVGGIHRLDEATIARDRARAEYERARAERAVVDAPARADEVLTARARVTAAQARVGLAKAELARTRVPAPSNGTILQRFAEPGDMAGPTTGQPILVMTDLSRLRVRAFVEELDAARVHPGQPAVVTADGLPGQEFKGVVSFVLPRMGRRGVESAAPGEYKDIYHREVLIDLDEGQTLPISLRVRVRIDAPSARTPATTPERPPGAAPQTPPASPVGPPPDRPRVAAEAPAPRPAERAPAVTDG